MTETKTKEVTIIRKFVMSGYPALRRMDDFQKCVTAILETTSTSIEGAYSFVGIGTSGTMYLTAIMMRQPNASVVLLSKPGESSHRFPVESMGSAVEDQIVIVDDMVERGSTIRNISSCLDGCGMLNRVVGIAAHGADHHASEWEELFPNLKFIIA